MKSWRLRSTKRYKLRQLLKSYWIGLMKVTTKVNWSWMMTACLKWRWERATLLQLLMKKRFTRNFNKSFKSLMNRKALKSKYSRKMRRRWYQVNYKIVWCKMYLMKQIVRSYNFMWYKLMKWNPRMKIMKMQNLISFLEMQELR